MKSRLRKHNLGAELKLRPEDLVIGTCFPVTSGLALDRVIVSASGEVECGLYRVSSNEGRSFGHAISSVGQREREDLEKLLAELAECEEQMQRLEEECDFSLYEEPERRSVRYWWRGREFGSSLPKQEYFLDQGIPQVLAEEYSRRFLAVWKSVNSIFERCQTSKACEDDAADVEPPRSPDGSRVKFDEIGYWSELKLEIIESYAQAYSTILSKQRLKHVYIDGFSGAGEHISKTTGDIVPGSPLNAVNLDPPFEEYYLVDLKGDKIEHLRSLVGDHGNVHLLEGDCNEVLLQQVFPNVLYEDYRRGLCLLDPYGLHLDWEVIAKAGEMKTLEIFLNFPIMDMNRNALWRTKEGPTPEHLARMTRFWGDDSWTEAVYRQAKQMSLFGEPELEKQNNEVVAEAFRARLKNVAGFQFVPKPLPMRNSKNAVVYYLFFASQNVTGGKIVNHIFDKYRDRRS